MPCFSSSVLTSSVHSASSSRVDKIPLPSTTTSTAMMPNQQPPPPPTPHRRHPIGPGGTRPMLREQDQYMPIANVIRIMRRILPPHAKISDDAKETIQECVSEYISFVTGEANDRCKRELRKTVTADDILWAMGKLGFANYTEPLAVYLSRYRDLEGDRRDPTFLLKRGMMHHDHDIGGPSGPMMMMMPPHPPALAPLAPPMAPPLAPLAPLTPLAPVDPAPVPDMAYNNFQMLQGDDQNMNQPRGMYDAGASSSPSDILNGYLYGSGSGQGSGGDGVGGDGEDVGAAQSGEGGFVPIYSPFN